MESHTLKPICNTTMYENGNMPFFSLALLKVIEGQGHVVWWRSVCLHLSYALLQLYSSCGAQ